MGIRHTPSLLLSRMFLTFCWLLFVAAVTHFTFLDWQIRLTFPLEYLLSEPWTAAFLLTRLSSVRAKLVSRMLTLSERSQLIIGPWSLLQLRSSRTSVCGPACSSLLTIRWHVCVPSLELLGSGDGGMVLAPRKVTYPEGGDDRPFIDCSLRAEGKSSRCS